MSKVSMTYDKPTAIRIRDFLKNQGCLTVVTTHYQELKHYALITDGFENASIFGWTSIFDTNWLVP